jgi:hypothetical protein
VSASKIGLFMGTPPLAGYNPALIPDDDQIDVGHAGTDDGLQRQLAELGDRHPLFFAIGRAG